MNLLDVHPVEIKASGSTGIPGISAFLQGTWVHGPAALQACRVDPQSVWVDVWKELTVQPIPVSSRMRHRADLAVEQLKTLCLAPEQPWVAAVPSAWTKEQLQVFLGVAEQCSLRIACLLPRSVVVACNSQYTDGPLTVLEWDWTELRILELEVVQGEWVQQEVRVVPELGILGCFRRESRLAAAWMLEQHRVDPLHSGQTEQNVFNDWWAWHKGEAPSWSILSGGAELRASEQAEALVQTHAEWLRSAGLSDEKSCLLTGMLSHVLGFTHATREKRAFTLPEAVLGASSSGVRWIESLPVHSLQEEPSRPVTHVVCNGVAEPVEEGLTARIGDTVTLKDGRTGLAIHVPER